MTPELDFIASASKIAIYTAVLMLLSIGGLIGALVATQHTTNLFLSNSDYKCEKI